MDAETRACKRLVARYKKRYKVLGNGRNRITFALNRDFVLKVPLHFIGVLDNQSELDRYSRFHPVEDIYAKPEAIVEGDGILVLKMERVYRLKKGTPEPWFYSFIDCGQVGRLRNGKIVAYDYGHY